MAQPPSTSRIGRAVRTGVALVVTLAIAVATPAAAGAATTTPSPEPIERADCPVPVPEQYAGRVECGVLNVPEVRSADTEELRYLRLPYAVIASTSADPAEDPLVVPTSGGPGGGTLGRLGYFLERGDWATSTHDVILIEQRGDLLAEPTLDCPELGISEFIEDGDYLSGEQSRTPMLAGLADCRARLVEDGVDLTAYTSRSSAADLTDLRTALGYDRWNLYGVSYSSRLALTVMRDRPAGLRAVILDGPVPPQLDQAEAMPAGFAGAVERLAAACAADAGCDAHYPALSATIDDVLAAAADSPLEVTVDSPVDGSAVRVQLDDTALADGLFQSLYDAETVRILPFLIDQLAHGNADAAVPLAQRQLDGNGRIAEGLQLSVDCAEEVPFSDPPAVESAYAAFSVTSPLDPTMQFAECETWEVPALGDAERAVVRSDVPTLITVGGFDPATPLAWGEAAAEGLSDVRLLEFARMAHGSVWQNWVDDCAARIAGQFLADPAAELDTSCVDDQPDVAFLTTADIDPTSAIYRFDRDIVQQREPIQLALGVLAIALMVATLVYGGVVAARRRLRLRGDIPAGTVLAAVTAAALNLAYAAGLALVIAGTDPLILAFGLPPIVWPLLLLPFAGLAVGILLVVLLVRAWIADDGTLFHRIALSASAAASIGFAVWLLARGLLLL